MTHAKFARTPLRARLQQLPACRLGALSLLAVLASPTPAELSPANAAGVSMGHLHYQVHDVAANAEFWIDLGGTSLAFSGGARISFPGVDIILTPGDYTGGTEGSVVNHIALRVESLEQIAAQGYELHLNEEYPGIASVFSPEGERVELFDDGVATNIGFELAAGQSDPVAQRHNEPLTVPVVSHHLHFYLEEDEVIAARDWYVKHFGATPGKRWRYDAADLPGMNLNFSANEEIQAPTPGRQLDHIGLEVENLETFCRELEDAGLEFDAPFRRLTSGFAVAALTDPWGTRIELTEGLSKLDSASQLLSFSTSQ